ncbi:MAG: TetR/AcrR family transcriptional regulator [Actinomycetota bacterium]|nr:TetR/AcrR family transcriptional regulator [Actinomycetota bacterium]
MQAQEPAAPAADGTRARLITAAERLFAERGIDGVSLREINRASGARNAVAVQYHFDDRAGVVRAVVAKHRPVVEALRHDALDEYESAGGADLWTLAGCLVRPLAAKLADPDGGPDYLQVHAELMNRTSNEPRSEAVVDPGDSIQRWRALVGPFLGQDAERLHRRFTAIRFSAAEVGRRASYGPRHDDRLFVSHLIDLVAALLVAPSSEETLRLADVRDAARQRRRATRR